MISNGILSMSQHIMMSPSPHPEYTASVVRVPALEAPVMEEMARLYLGHYDGSSDTRFRHDLSEKDEVVLLFADGVLVGFTAMRYFPFHWNGKLIQVVYSGDTIVAPEHWGQQRLAFRWINRVGEIKRQCGDRPLYWLLLVKGHRTFRYLPAFAQHFYPTWTEDNHDLKPLRDTLARALFGEEFNPDTGLLEFQESRGHLSAGIAQPSARELNRPETRFFLQKNPDYLRGHELVCLCELSAENLKPLAARIFRQSPTNGLQGI